MVLEKRALLRIMACRDQRITRCRRFQTHIIIDRGTEFLNKPFQAMLAKENISITHPSVPPIVQPNAAPVMPMARGQQRQIR